jgi:SAM-dependent methyltransferase
LKDDFLKSRSHSHLDYYGWSPQEKLKYFDFVPDKVTTVLDVGCGRGEMLWLLKTRGFKVAGCDIDSFCLKKASSIVKEVKYANVEELSAYYPSESFDLITCLHVLEHCRSPYACLTEIGIVSRKFVLVAVPNARYIIHDERETHLYSWNVGTLANLLGEVGFQVQKLSEDWVNRFPNILKTTPILHKIYIAETILASYGISGFGNKNQRASLSVALIENCWLVSEMIDMKIQSFQPI